MKMFGTSLRIDSTTSQNHRLRIPLSQKCMQCNEQATTLPSAALSRSCLSAVGAPTHLVLLAGRDRVENLISIGGIAMDGWSLIFTTTSLRGASGGNLLHTSGKSKHPRQIRSTSVLGDHWGFQEFFTVCGLPPRQQRQGQRKKSGHILTQFAIYTCTKLRQMVPSWPGTIRARRK